MILRVLQQYETFKEKNFNELTLKHNQVLTLIGDLKNKLAVTEIGKSFENKEIFKIKIGHGTKKILLWSQMHGNEPVGTMVIFDLLNFFMADDEFNQLRENLLESCTFYFIPMLNPDGAELFIRRNAQGIDLNRDALKLTASESKILDKITTEFMPDFAFNLHDQETYYAPENSSKSTVISLLSPAFDYEKNIDEKRAKSMLLISDIFSFLKKIIPEQVAKYNDSFMPNAFGDNIQKKGISTVLFEAGYISGDNHRQTVRKFYFTSILYAFHSISTENYNNFQLFDYQQIPMNLKLKFCDILLKNVTVKISNKSYLTDIAINKNLLNTEKFTDLVEDYIIWDIGDLDNLLSFKIIDMKGKTIEIEKNMLQRLKKADFLYKYIEM